MKSARILREKIDGDKLTLGVMAAYHLWPDLVEICRNAGVDFLIVDTEHMTFDEALVAQVCTVGRLIDFPVLIRPPESEFSYIRRALDKGAVGLLLPQIRTAGELDAVREAIYMPPRGHRRVGGPGNRWPADFHYPTWRETVEDHLVILPQVESLDGLQNAEALARHEITTAMAIGPYDLSTELGVCWQPDSPKLVEALERIRQAGKAAGKNTMMVGDARTLVKRGFNFICAAEPSMLLEATLKNLTQSLRELR